MLEIAFGLMSIALLALLVGHSRETATIVSSVATNFDSLLRTVTLQSTSGIGRSYYA